ncbi:MAG: exodeoxyribonuclease VII large subunit [Chloroflexi bacterium]|nr:exodeoxyribonuclease VII large subunit [Chloroflexota bacterium]
MTEIITVSQLTDYLSGLFEEDALLADVYVAGEISNATVARSGHFYFSLKDAGASISCVMWRSALRRLYDAPQEGERVVVHGHVALYAPRGQLQIVVDAIRLEGGIGDLYRRFEQIKERLQAEGLFDAERKRPLPEIPRRIGVVTSATGAALRDILRVLRHRWPLADVLLAPSLVQGEQAPASLQAALLSLYQRDDIDVIVLARGGGSIEDLWAFNDEGLARLVARSPAPVVTGVGHETDFTIVDFVADHRAATPSAAAAAVSPDANAIRQGLDALAERLTIRILDDLERRRLLLQRQEANLRRLSPQNRIQQQRLTLNDLTRRLQRVLDRQLNERRLTVDALAQRLDALNPAAVLGRGYAIVQDEQGRVIHSVRQVRPGQPLDIRVSDGDFPARVEKSFP